MEPTSRKPVHPPVPRSAGAEEDRIPSDLADEVMELAARLHAQSRTTVSRSELASIAREVDIPAEYVHHAFEQVRSEHERAKKSDPGGWYALAILTSLVGACYLAGWFRVDSPIGLHRASLAWQIGAFGVLVVVLCVLQMLAIDALFRTGHRDVP